MARAFGVPYKGSKNKIGKKLLEQIPQADIFVDLFAGGCAMSHIALLSDKYKKVIANDINKAPELFLKAINGEFKNERRWISRDEFHKLKYTDMYIATVWSFGNKLDGYLYSKEIEPYKKAYHYAKVFGDFSLFNEFAPYIEKEFRGNLRKYIKDNQERIKKDYINWFIANISKDTEKLQKYKFTRLERLQSLERLERLDIADKLSISNTCYKDFKLPKSDECVIYCDIPYKDTDKYHHDGKELEFNYDEFYDWCREKAKQGYKIYISEYQMPSDFKVVFELEHLSILSAKRPNKAIEKLFTI
jgi:hypothetical protein